MSERLTRTYVAMSADWEDHKRHGFWFTWGVILALGVFGLIVTIVTVLSVALNCFRPIDSTDAGELHRSGLQLRTDHLTACQYLETSGGALTPRLGADGKQICGARP